MPTWITIENGLPNVGENVLVVTEYLDKGKEASDTFYGYMDEYGELFSLPEEESYGWQFNDCVKKWARISLTDESETPTPSTKEGQPKQVLSDAEVEKIKAKSNDWKKYYEKWLAIPDNEYGNFDDGLNWIHNEVVWPLQHIISYYEELIAGYKSNSIDKQKA